MVVSRPASRRSPLRFAACFQPPRALGIDEFVARAEQVPRRVRHHPPIKFWRTSEEVGITLNINFPMRSSLSHAVIITIIRVIIDIQFCATAGGT